MNNNFKYRVRFTKTGNMKFIGHLDLLKVFERVTKRVGLPMAYSNGFNPHQLMSFAVPLSLGIESTAEYLDFQLTEKLDYNEILSRFNSGSTFGMEFTSVRELESGEQSGASMVCAGDYEIIPDKRIEQAVIDDILSKEEIIIEKKTKKKTAFADIRADIFSLSTDGERLFAKISTGSAKNLKPDILMSYIYSQSNYEFLPYRIKYKRTELYKQTENGFETLMGEDK